jgi:cyclophilin family peptidyl-prolyl cis-trans isomerase
MIKPFLYVSGALLCVAGLYAAAPSVASNAAAAADHKKPAAAEPKPAAQQEAVVETSMGTFTIAFLTNKAPATCKNFITLAQKGFYNGLTFHRVIPNFMIQGGCPKGDGTGDAGYKIKSEFNDTKHVPGVVSMARAMDPDSAGSQFFVCVATCPWLDGQYTAFGTVTKEYEVVEKISKTPTTENDRPVTPVIIKSITIK